MAPFKWFFSFLKKYGLLMFLGLFLDTLISLLAFVNPYISGIIVDDVIKGGAKELLMKFILIMVIVVVIKGICRYFSQVCFEVSSQGVLFKMRDTVYRKLLQEDFSFYNRNRTGDLMSRQTGDMDALRHFVAFVIYQVWENVLYFVVALIMIFTVNTKLALCMVVVLPFTAFTTYKQAKNVRPAFWRIRQQFSSLNTFVQENISGNRVVKAFAKEDYEMQKFQKENDAYRDAELESTKKWKKYIPIYELLSNILTIIIFLYGGILVIRGELSVGKLVTVNGYLWMLTVPLRMAGWLTNDVYRFITSVEKIYGTYSAEPDIKEPLNPDLKKKYEGNIKFEGVSYRADEEEIIRNVSFEAHKGQTIGIIGSTGSGKTTIMNLLCRFYDVTRGEVTIDGINVKDLDLYNLRANIGIAMQDVFLFSDTVEGNIAYGKPKCSFEKVKEAAIMADANHFIAELPNGYDTIIGERGVGLSGGQKQRISLARALLKDPSILILDDTTSAVDMETESYIQEQLKKLDKKCTIFVIAYRISSIMNADLILVMDGGKIVERGTHEELMKQNGYYATTYFHQYGETPDITKAE